jgi:hypothetical protein
MLLLINVYYITMILLRCVTYMLSSLKIIMTAYKLLLEFKILDYFKFSTRAYRNEFLFQRLREINDLNFRNYTSNITDLKMFIYVFLVRGRYNIGNN